MKAAWCSWALSRSPSAAELRFYLDWKLVDSTLTMRRMQRSILDYRKVQEEFVDSIRLISFVGYFHWVYFCAKKMETHLRWPLRCYRITAVSLESGTQMWNQIAGFCPFWLTEERNSVLLCCECVFFFEQVSRRWIRFLPFWLWDCWRILVSVPCPLGRVAAPPPHAPVSGVRLHAADDRGGLLCSIQQLCSFHLPDAELH